MKEEKNTFLHGSLLWFGAAISIAEIFTGALLAPLGMVKGILAILLGHGIGCILFYFVGLIGAKTQKGAMESTAQSFGRFGSLFFAFLNTLQLMGWTAIMILSGAEAMNLSAGFGPTWLWCLIIGAFVFLWVWAGPKNVGKLNTVAVSSLLLLCLFLGVLILKGHPSPAILKPMSFGLGLELSIAMPISWLPLISDYTKLTKSPKTFTGVSTISYFFGSCFMYLIGLGASLLAGTSDVILLLRSSGLGVIAMIIAVFSTVTTTYLDVYSAEESFRMILPFAKAKYSSLFFCILGTAFALFLPMHRFETFLYWIGSVFVPMAVILIADYFIFPREVSERRHFILNFSLWFLGFFLYRYFLTLNTPLGSTIPVVGILFFVCTTIKIFEKAVRKDVRTNPIQCKE